MSTTQKRQLTQKANWVQAPSLLQVLLFIIAWIVGVGLLVLVITDLFTERIFARKHTLIYAMIVFSTWSTAKLVINFFKQKRLRIK